MKTLRKFWWLALIAGGWLLAHNAHAHAADGPSFNCRYAKTPDEVLICQEPILSGYDQRMARLYSEFVEPVDPRNWPSDGPTISEVRGIIQWAKSSQVTWLRTRRACGYNFACIEDCI